MDKRLIFSLGILVVLSSCQGFEPYTTVSKLNAPPARTVDTKLQMEEVTGSAGKNIHDYMNRLAVNIKAADGIEVKSTEQGFRITIDSQYLFAGSSHTLKDYAPCKEVFKAIMQSVHSEYLVEVHTDGEGTRYFNQGLGERRAASLKDMLVKIDFPMDRLQLRSYGEDQPIADNSFDWGKQANRRIEIAVFASDDLKEKAQKGPVFD